MMIYASISLDEVVMSKHKGHPPYFTENQDTVDRLREILRDEYLSKHPFYDDIRQALLDAVRELE